MESIQKLLSRVHLLTAQSSASREAPYPASRAHAHLACIAAISAFALMISRTVCSTPLTLLLADTDGPTPPTSRLAVLSTHPQAPVVPQTTMRTDLLQPLQVVAKLAVHAVGQDLRVLAVHDVALTIEEPGGDLVLSRVLNDGHDSLEFFGSELAGAVK